MEKSQLSIELCLSQLINADETFVRNSLKDGIDVTEESQVVSQKLNKVHRDAVTNCKNNAENLAVLHEQIEACDKVFERLEDMLCGFQKSLGKIGEDMKHLQVQSLDIHQELENRQKVRTDLSQFVDDIVVPQTMISTILNADPGDRIFIEKLHELHYKVDLIQSRGNGEAVAVHDAFPILENLKLKAIEKIRDWLLVKISQFRKPLSNYQVFQMQLLKCRFFYEFVEQHDPTTAKEIKDDYIETVGKMFFTYFKVYSSRLFKLNMKDAASKDDLLGTVDSAKSSTISSFFGSKPQVRSKATVFSLGDRHQVLTTEFLSALIVPHAATQNNATFQFESLFRSLQFSFVDQYSHELLFCSDFFSVDKLTAYDIVSKVMSKAIGVLLKSCEEQIDHTFDAISLYICVCLCEKFHHLLAERGVPAVNSYWEKLTNNLWTKFDIVMKSHNDSVRMIDLKKLQGSSLDTRPHYIIRRYGELTSSLLTISSCMGRDVGPKMEALLESSEDATEQLLGKIAAVQANKKDKNVFLINNYDLILNIIDDSNAKTGRIYAIVHELEQKTIDELVDVILAPHLDEIMKLVNECEPLVKQGHTQLLVRYNDRLEAATTNFQEIWKKSIETIHNETVSLFTNFRLGTHVLQAVYSNYVQVLQRFSKIITHDAFQNTDIDSRMLNVHQVMIEIKKFKPLY